LIDKIPTGRRRRGVRKASSKGMARARGWIAAQRERWPSLETKPFGELSIAERFDVLQQKALDILWETLNLPDGAGKPRDVRSRMRLKQDAALFVIRLQARIDPDKLRHRNRPDLLVLMRERL